jgi:hypothetical protein
MTAGRKRKAKARVAASDDQAIGAGVSTEDTVAAFPVPCTVLSGTGSDGTQGVRAVKGEGETGANTILRMAREGLRRDLTTALPTAVAGQQVVRCPGRRVTTNGETPQKDGGEQ